MIPVKWYTNATINGLTMGGMPRCAGVAGDLLAVLDLLVNGANTVTLDSLTRTGTTATATRSGGVSFVPHQVIAIAGANQGEWNDEYRVLTVTSTQVTFAVPDTHTVNPTGTITMKAAPAGWALTPNGVNRGYLRANDVTATRLYLGIDDTAATVARVRGFTEIAPETGPFPTVSQVAGPGAYIYRSVSADQTGRRYLLVADTHAFYLFIEWDDSYFDGTYFGDIDSWKFGDAFNCALIAQPYAISSSGSSDDFFNNSSGGRYLARSFTQIGAAIAFSHIGPKEQSGAFGSGGYAYPSPPNNGLILYYPVRVAESSAVPRGIMPGLHVPLHSKPMAGMANFVMDIAQHPGKIFLPVTGRSGQVFLDIAGPWR